MKPSVLLITLCFLWNCSTSGTEDEPQIISAAGTSADFPQMVQDQNGDPVAFWVEKDAETGDRFVHFSHSSSANFSFGENRKIPVSRNVNPGPGESMPKLIIKPDGTYLLVFARPNQNSDSQFAGSVLFTQSFDEGANWTEPKPVHSDTDPDNSHGFPEAILLPDGEIGAVWLDGRNNLEHSELYFAKTEGKEGFGEDQRIGGPACQCCKLDMYVDENRMLHLAYRSLTEDNIRDMAHLSSDDNGDTFSEPVRVHEDNWQIMACPHNGPSVIKNNGNLYVIWYTQGGEEGLYYAGSQDNGHNFSSRNRLAIRANHPYIASFKQSAIAVWDESYRKEEDRYLRVKMARISGEEEVDTKFLSPENVEASMPSLLEMENGDVVISWTERHEDENKIRFLKVPS